MKKSVIVLILLAVMVIIISPGLIGKLAEERVSENLNWAAEESGELVVTSVGFDRGWFSSEGQHRIEVGEGTLRETLSSGSDPMLDERLPALLIDTRIDHGIVPLTSLTRDKGSLAPGLGRAVSTLSIESGDGETWTIPGTIYSEIGLGGQLVSTYELPAGSHTVEGAYFAWEDGKLEVNGGPTTGDISFDGDFGTISVDDGNAPWSIEGMAFDGSMKATPHGFYVGDMDFEMKSLTVSQNGMSIQALNGATLAGESSLDDGRVNGSFRLEADGKTSPVFGDAFFIAEMSFTGLDAAAWGEVTRKLDAQPATALPADVMAAAENDLMDLVAAGFEIDVSQFDVGTPMGTITSTMNLSVPEADRDNFAWSSLLLSLNGELNLSVPEMLVQFASSMDPEAGALIGMGYLVKDGDAYTMDAKIAKGLLTVNGAPMPLPVGMFD